MPSPLPPSRFLRDTDFATYSADVQAVVARYFDAAGQQHPARRIEYALALDAIQRYSPLDAVLHAIDVGGAGSPFVEMLYAWQRIRATIIDPEHATSGQTLAQYVEGAPRLSQVITCLSVLEHVEDLPGMIEDLATVLLPGGLLILTVDAIPSDVVAPPDTYHFHWMRKRIFSQAGLTQLLILPFAQLGLHVWTPPDWPFGHPYQSYTPVAPWVYDYTMASLVLTKPRRRLR